LAIGIHDDRSFVECDRLALLLLNCLFGESHEVSSGVKEKKYNKERISSVDRESFTRTGDPSFRRVLCSTG
jgi:hypothetical protein